MRRPLALLALTAATALAPSAAHAAPAVVSPTSSVEAGPALAPDGKVLWAQFTKDARLTVHSGAPGAAPATVFTTPGPTHPTNGELLGGRLAATPTRALFSYSESVAVDPDGYLAFSKLLDGPLTGPLTTLAGDDDGKSYVHSFDVSGEAVLIAQSGSEYGSSQLQVREGNGAPKLVGPPDASGGQIAGDYVAYGTAGASGSDTQVIHVLNWRTGVELYRTTAPFTAPYAYGFGFDVQEDGTLAILQANPASTGAKPVDDLAFASPAQLTPKVLATDVDPLTLRIRGGQILFARSTVNGSQQQLLLSDLAGSVRAASFPLDYLRGYDFDGTRVAYATPRCVYVDTVGAGTPTEPPSGDCARMATSTFTANKLKLATVQAKVTCTMAPASGCPATTRIRTAAPRPRTLATSSSTIATGATKVVTLKVSNRTLRSLRKQYGRKRRSLIVNVRTTVTDDAGRSTSSYQQGLLKLR